jgi:hypothetical protein
LPVVDLGYNASVGCTPATEEGSIMVLYARVWSPGQLLVLAGGIVTIVFGAIAVVDGGLSSPLNQPVVQVFGFDHTPLLGLIEIGAGALLVLSALLGTRATSMVLSMLFVVGGVLVLAQPDWIQTHLTTQSEFGWVLVIIGGVCVLALTLTPEIRARRRLLH